MEGLNKDLEENRLKADGLSKLSIVGILIRRARENERRKEAAI